MEQTSNLDRACLESCMVGEALDGMCVGMVMTNAADRVTWINRSAQRILGIDRDESMGRRLTKVLRDPNLAEFWHKASAEEGVLMGEVALHWPERRELKANTSPCQNQAGECIGRALLFCDVTAERAVQLQMSQDATKRLLDMAGNWQARNDGTPHEGLTAQELRILRMVGAGHGNHEIAAAIHIAPSTVRTHLKHVYAKLKLTSRSEAISYAVRNGMV